MDRLFDHRGDRESQQHRERKALVELELRVELHRRVRHALTLAAVLASTLCWAYTRFSVPALASAPPLFAFFALFAATIYLGERRLDVARQELAARLPRRLVLVSLIPTLVGCDPLVRAQQLDQERKHLRAIRRTLATGSALFGISAFLGAIAPQLVPSLVAALRAGWVMSTLALAAIGIDELLVCLERARVRRRP